MAVARRSSSSVVSTVNGTSVVLPKPAGAQEGDLLLVWLSFNQASVTLTTPDDSWMAYLRGQPAGAGGICEWFAWAKVAATDGTDYTFTAGVSGGFAVGCVAYYSTTGQDVNPYGLSLVEPAAGTSQSTNSLTTLNADDIVISSFSCDLAGTDNFVPSSPGNLTEILDVEDHSFNRLGMFEEIRAAAGAGAHTITKTDATLTTNAYIVAVTETGNVTFVGGYRSNATDPLSGTFFLPDRFIDGDVAIFIWYTRDQAKTFTEDGNVTQLYDTADASAGRLFIGYRWLTVGDGDPTWTSSTVATADTFWAVLVFRNVTGSPGSPFEAESGTPGTTPNAINPVEPAATALTADGFVLTLFGKNNDFLNTPETGGVLQTTPTGYFYMVSQMSTAGSDGSYGVAGKKSAVGSENPGAWSLQGGAATDDSLVWTGILGPAADAAAGWVASHKMRSRGGTW